MKRYTFLQSTLIAIIGLTLFTGCNGKKKSKTGGLFGVTGTPMEMVAVIPVDIDTPSLRDSIKATFGRPLPILPSEEPMVSAMTTNESNFSQMFKSMRNVLYVSIDSTLYTRPSVGIARDQYANGQLIIHAKAESVEGFYHLLRERGEYLTNLIHQEELGRVSAEFETTYSSALAKTVEETIGGWTIHVSNLTKYTNTATNFVWASDQGLKGRTDFRIYTYPYKGAESLTPSHIIVMRDSVLQKNVKGQYEGSYMTTEKRVDPRVRKFEYKGIERIELRGLWAMVGDMMGGPYVLHAVLDEARGRVIVAEMAIFNPSGKKKNLMIYAESQLYTLRPVEPAKED